MKNVCCLNTDPLALIRLDKVMTALVEWRLPMY